jgi:hypothetical protein
MIAALFAALACAATPLHGEPLPWSGSLSSLPWVQGSPARRGIFGMVFGLDRELEDPAAPTFALYAHGVSPHGHTTKVLWLVRSRYASWRFLLRGRDLATGAAFRQTFYEVQDANPRPAIAREYASIVKLPHAGCWRLDARSGRARASFVVRAVEL